ncbi:GlsB/YeaQ/YmgE family stress response membrane protein [Arenimonas sp.]|uniref:GlsB/YeaQ/YmgE family stress response membrane protein n=1 Tax=Arenimonas sp. TaxID=1872635 RepID=UPI0025BAF780|nr:GlsB/YeaQ/YmgE family stress response membrane protein [Arenimonas sp.]
MNLLIFLLIGALAGWLAGVVMKGRGFGVLVNIVVGVLGAFFGGWLLPKLGLSFGGDMGLFITAFIGAILLLAIIGLIKKA